jgi:hypothetical protein
MERMNTFFQYPLNDEHPYSTHDPLKEKRSLRPLIDEKSSKKDGEDGNHLPDQLNAESH